MAYRAVLESLTEAVVVLEAVRAAGLVVDPRMTFLDPAAEAILGLGAEAVVVLDPGERVRWAAGEVLSTLGLDPAGMIGRTPRELLPEPQADGLTELVRGALAGQPRGRRHAHLGRIWQTDVTPLRGPDGQVTGAVQISHDVTEHVHELQARDRMLSDLREAQRLARLGSWRWDAKSCRVHASPELLGMLGLEVDGPEPETLPALQTLVGPDDVSRLRAARDRVLVDERPFTLDQSVVRPDGSTQYLLVRGAVMLDDENRPVGVRGTVQDVSELRRSELALRESEERFRLAFDESLLGKALVAVDPDGYGQVLRVNPRLCRLVRRPAEELIGSGLWEVLRVHTADLPAAATAFADLVAGRRDAVRSQLRLRRPGAVIAWVNVAQVLVRDGHGDPLYALVQLEDVTARREAENELRRQAASDELTGLPNRTALLTHLEQLLGAEADAGEVGVLFLDIDDFKTVNDSLGHEAGDGLLRSVAELLAGCLQPGDFASRLGGDEFVLICSDPLGKAPAMAMATRVQAALAQEIPVGAHLVRVTVSVGIAIGRASTTAADLLRDADMAMYRAKAAGKDRWALADTSAHAGAMRRLTMEAGLRRAVERDELRLLYMPVVHLVTGAMVGVEALLRWQHPERGLLRPETFLDVAEGTALMVPIGEWILDAACARAAGWRSAYGEQAPLVAINVSTRQLGGPRLHRRVDAALAAYGLPPSALCVELTEREAIATSGEQAQDLDRLHEGGVLLAIDDFGTGYAGLDYLRRFPVDILKIDRSLIARLDRDPTDTAITAGLVALGRSLGLTVVAEGVEAGTQRDSLVRLGCPQGQGAYWSAATDADRIDAWLRAGGIPVG